MSFAPFGLFLDWELCPDGVEFVPEDVSDPLFRVYRNRSERRRAARWTITNLEDPVVIRFVNARDEPSRLKFFTRFGMLNNSGATSEESLDKSQRPLRTLLERAGSGDVVTARKAIVTATARHNLSSVFEIVDVSGGAPRLTMLLAPDGPIQYMRMEAATVALHGALYRTCKHCGNAFLTGPLTGRRSHAEYCSDRCRVAAMRKRNASR